MVVGVPTVDAGVGGEVVIVGQLCDVAQGGEGRAGVAAGVAIHDGGHTHRVGGRYGEVRKGQGL